MIQSHIQRGTAHIHQVEGFKKIARIKCGVFFYIPFCRLALAIPMLDDGHSKCSMYAVNFTELFAAAEANGTAELLADPSWPMQPCVYGWEYDREEIPYSTIATEVSNIIYL